MLSSTAVRCLGAAYKRLMLESGVAVSTSVLRSKQLPSSSRDYATGAQLSKKEVVSLLGNTADPEVSATLKEYLKSAYTSGVKASSAAPEPASLTDGLEKKYIGAQTIEYGLQTISAPLSDSDEPSAIKRYASETLTVASKAFFEDPYTEVYKRLASASKTSDTVKDLLSQAKSAIAPDFYASLSEALQAVEAEVGSAVTLDGASAGYKKFAEKVKALATSQKIPVDVLVSVKKGAFANEDAKDKALKSYRLWLQQAVADDAKAEIEALKADAVAVLDKHLSKTAAQIKKEHEAFSQQLLKKIDSASGAEWAQKVKEDLKLVSWFDAAVARNPTKGPVVSA